MKFDVTVIPANLNIAASTARVVENYGFDGLWTPEIARDPFLPLSHAANATSKINIGTGIAVAFPRGPMIVANTAWDLVAQSGGRTLPGIPRSSLPHRSLPQRTDHSQYRNWRGQHRPHTRSRESKLRHFCRASPRRARSTDERCSGQIAFYASTPSYAPVLDLHGWGNVRAELSKMARSGK
jgi:Luciferase-like monooxygenase